MKQIGFVSTLNIIIRLIFIVFSIFILIAVLIESQEQDRIRITQEELGVDLKDFIAGTAGNRYTRDDAVLDFLVRDGEIKEIKINLDAITSVTSENTERIEQLEESHRRLDDEINEPDQLQLRIMP